MTTSAWISTAYLKRHSMDFDKNLVSFKLGDLSLADNKVSIRPDLLFCVSR